ncbi:SPOR domain-containing protein [Candidatus Magnetaquicoccus inordinatus]|uniref:SPOR domain-containing protein n=1 Tax=Candidatus Magnetaquicoccus inordinatus TaxID=2496818 RepID=UPI00102AC626|nr:SPOR domain-containing protein [Candidatus Magnetaquicoccus inordinatus]
MTPRYPTSSRFRRHQRPSSLPRILLAATVVGGGLYFLFRPGKNPEAQQQVAQPAAQEQPLRTSQTAPAELKTESKGKATLEMKVDPKAESKPLAVAEIKAPPASKTVTTAEKSEAPAARPAPVAELRAPPRPESKTESKTESKPESKPENKTETKQEVKAESRSGKQEIKLDIRPESRSEVKTESKPASKAESGSDSKGDNKTAAKGESGKSDLKNEASSKKGGKQETVEKGKNETAPANSGKGPLLPQPKADDEAGFHPLPDGLLPKHREQEMDLTFYKGLAMKKMILPEEPAGKKIIPPFLAGVSPSAVNANKRSDSASSPDKSAASKPNAEANKKVTENKQPADKVNSADKKNSPDKKKSYQVQIAILSEQKNATAMADVMRAQGAPNPRISSHTYANGKTVYRVRLGPFANQSDAAKAGQRWQHPGQPALITAVEE